MTMSVNTTRTIETVLIPDGNMRKRIERGANADSRLCWTCGSCEFECPVNIATGRLRPQKIVRMANLGMLDELLQTPEVWYCQSCRRCAQVCPNTVKPAELIAHIRRMAVEQNLLPVEKIRAYRMLFARFQRVRRQAVIECLQGKVTAISDRQWCAWLLSPPEETRRTVRVAATKGGTSDRFDGHDVARAAACFTCGECSSACPVSCERSVFDPRTLFRMVNLGLMDEVLSDPAIWLCLDCGRCTAACSQLVDGRDIIRRLKDRAVQKGIVDRTFFMRLEHANRLVYTRWIEEVDALLGFNDTRNRARTTPMNDFSVCCRDYAETAFACAHG